MVNSRYVIGDFDNSGIYSGLRNTRTNTLVDQYRNTNVSSSLTQIPRLNQQISKNSSTGSIEELQRNSIQQYREYRWEQNNTVRTPERSPRSVPNFENGFVDEIRPNYRSGRPSKTSYGSGSSTGSLLGGAAWNQLSQPSMEHFVNDVVSLYSDVGSDSHYLSDELERLSNELIMEGDEEPEETLV